jgi:hypothetical protein
MSFKQVWTDRPDERFDVKTREVLVEIIGDSRPGGSAAPRSDAPAGLNLVYGLPVEVELLPTNPAADAQAMHFPR